MLLNLWQTFGGSSGAVYDFTITYDHLLPSITTLDGRPFPSITATNYGHIDPLQPSILRPVRLSAQRQGSAGPWHKVFSGWRRSKYFMSWSRMHPIVGQHYHNTYFNQSAFRNSIHRQFFLVPFLL